MSMRREKKRDLNMKMERRRRGQNTKMKERKKDLNMKMRKKRKTIKRLTDYLQRRRKRGKRQKRGGGHPLASFSQKMGLLLMWISQKNEKERQFEQKEEISKSEQT